MGERFIVGTTLARASVGDIGTGRCVGGHLLSPCVESLCRFVPRCLDGIPSLSLCVCVRARGGGVNSRWVLLLLLLLVPTHRTDYLRMERWMQAETITIRERERERERERDCVCVYVCMQGILDRKTETHTQRCTDNTLLSSPPFFPFSSSLCCSVGFLMANSEHDC